MAIQTEVWVSDIKEVLFDGPNEFLRKATNHDAFVEDSKVHVPQAGTMPSVKKNRTSLPATISERTDTDLEYTLDEYTTDPILLRNIDKIQVSYDRRASYMRHHMNKLKDRMAKEGIFDWASNLASQQVRTTGSDGVVNGPAGSTGNRKKVALTDINNLSQLMDEQNVPDEGRWLMLPARMYHELFDIAELINRENMGSITVVNGIVAKVLGFNLIKRSTAQVYDNTATPLKNAVNAAVASADNHGAIAWHPDFVSSALGDIKVFDDQDKPEFFGDVMSALVMSKTSKLRTDEVGIAALIQTAS